MTQVLPATQSAGQASSQAEAPTVPEMNRRRAVGTTRGFIGRGRLLPAGWSVVTPVKDSRLKPSGKVAGDRGGYGSGEAGGTDRFARRDRERIAFGGEARPLALRSRLPGI